MAVYGIAENKCLKEVVAKDNFIFVNKIFQIEPNVQGTYVLTADDLGLETTTSLMVISHMFSMNGDDFYMVDKADTTSTNFNRILIDTEDDEVRIHYGHQSTHRTSVYVKVALMVFE